MVKVQKPVDFERQTELSLLQLNAHVVYLDVGGDMFLRNVGSYKSHTASQILHSINRLGSVVGT
jgi:hypothetical protein